ncbi:hypothetical protein [Streptomyces sp. NPDC056682]|uniref:hypothetical protein n=1 Tax=Streptomyces sp. NPDC056682 TaxID=3345909 RepID=UPI00368708DE
MSCRPQTHLLNAEQQTRLTKLGIEATAAPGPKARADVGVGRLEERDRGSRDDAER